MTGERTATLCARVTDPSELVAVPPEADLVELRGDAFAGFPTTDRRTIYSLGPHAGGRDRLREAAKRYALVDYDIDQDAIRDDLPRNRRVLTVHVGPEDDPGRTLARLTRGPARLHRVVASFNDLPTQAAWVEAIVGTRAPVAFEAPGSIWAHLLVAHLGAPIVFGTPGDGPGSLRRLALDCGLPRLRSVERLCGIVGARVAGSLSPRLHNASYAALAVPALYLPLAPARWSDVAALLRSASVGLPLAGLTVASPFKAALASAVPCDPIGARARSANTLARGGEGWVASTVDDAVVDLAIRRGLPVKDADIAVVGCGGAGRCVAAALAGRGARVHLFNRCAERGEAVARALDVPFSPLEALEPARFAGIVDATSVGREGGETAFDTRGLAASTWVADLVYGTAPTELVVRARASGCAVIDGRDVLLAEMARQFEAMTGRAAPVDVIRGVIDAY